MKYLAIILVVIFIAGCTPKKAQEKNNLDIIELSEGINDEGKIVYLSEFAKNVEYIFLETKEECLIGSVDKVMINNSLVFVNNREQLFIFNDKGKFVRSIGRKGKGPGEYSRIMDFSINRTNNRIYVLDPGLSKIIVYQFNGEFDFEFRIDTRPSKITCVDDKYIVLTHSRPMYIQNDNFCFSYYSLKGELIHKNFNRENENAEIREPATSLIKLKNYNDSLTFWEVNLDTIYRVSDLGNVTPRYKIKLKGDNHDSPVTGGAIPQNKFNYSYFLETENYLLFTRGAINNKIKHILYNKKTSKAVNLKTEELDLSFQLKYGGFTNDFDGGMPFLPFDVLSNGKLYNTFFPVELINLLEERNSVDFKIKNPEKHEFLKKQLEKIGKNGNPVIMLVTL